MQAAEKLRILVVDDEPQILVALEDLLSERFTVFATGSAEDALHVMERERDIAVLITDQRMPRMTGDELLAAIGPASDTQRIMLTGFADLSAVIRAVNDGRIFSYVTKPWNPEDLQLKVQTAADHFRLARELAYEQEALRESEERLQKQTRMLNSILSGMGDGVVAVDRTGEVIVFNERAERILGKPPLASVPHLAGLYPVYDAETQSPISIDRDPLRRTIAGEAVDESEMVVKNGAHEWTTVTTNATALLDEEGRIAGGILLLKDVTQQKSLERQLAQSQKLEALGRLAGGIAHDFNNVLAVMICYATLLREEFAVDSRQWADMQELLDAGERAAALTRQLLSFSRRRVVATGIFDLNEILSEVEKMLRRLLGEDIDLVTRLAPDLGAVTGDPSQVEQIVLNLAINARDAMPEGGKLTIETQNVTLDSEYVESHAKVAPGEYVVMAVTDTGIGMDAQTQRRIFEPFFTTKEVGKGTGLGLSTVYGIVHQRGGHIWVYSELGRGTSFKVYLPRVDASGVRASVRRPALAPVRGTGTILVVEDDDAVRRVSIRILRTCGYNVVEASRVVDARRLCTEMGPSIDLLLTDVVMPEISGVKLAEELTMTLPNLRVLYMSGYPGGAVIHDGILPPGTTYIEKPFSSADLAEKVRTALSS